MFNKDFFQWHYVIFHCDFRLWNNLIKAKEKQNRNQKIVLYIYTIEFVEKLALLQNYLRKPLRDYPHHLLLRFLATDFSSR